MSHLSVPTVLHRPPCARVMLTWVCDGTRLVEWE